jgi:hypothetical protein
MNPRIAPVAVALLVTVAAAVAVTSARGSRFHDARSASSRFSARVDNAWFPLTPGTIAVYTGVKDGKKARDVVTVTHETTTIAGAPCRVVRDRLYLDGRLAEHTTDWYTQDSAGNVWYFGERTAELDRRGRVTSTEGSWQAGVDGAKPGIFMPARPRVGDAYRQEFYKGHAEDRFRIVGLFERTVSPLTSNALLTQESTPLEPGVIDHKLYVRGIGTVVERTVKGGDEHLELASLRKGP